MKSKNIDDILNEMRNRADTVIEGRTITERKFVPQEKVEEWADQIESAVKHMHGLAQAHCNMLAKAVKYHKDKPIGNAAALRETLSDACYAMFNFLKAQNGGYEEMANALDKAKAALAKPPRACDLMTEEELSRVVSRSIVASVSSRPELNEEWIKSLVGAAATAAIKCAYDTQLKSSKESNNYD